MPRLRNIPRVRFRLNANIDKPILKIRNRQIQIKLIFKHNSGLVSSSLLVVCYEYTSKDT